MFELDSIIISLLFNKTEMASPIFDDLISKSIVFKISFIIYWWMLRKCCNLFVKKSFRIFPYLRSVPLLKS